MLVLATLAALSGIATTGLIRLTTDSRALGLAFNRIYAHLLEFRLFFDEPGLIWRAQIELVRDNLRLMQLLLLPMLLLAIPMTWLFVQLDAVYGHRPLRAGEAAVVTAQMGRAIGAGERIELRGTGGVQVETPGVRIAREKQVVWRIRAAREGAVQLIANGRAVRTTVSTGDRLWMLSSRWLPRFGGGDVAWLEVAYPEDGVSWIVWYLAISSGAALIWARCYPWGQGEQWA